MASTSAESVKRQRTAQSGDDTTVAAIGGGAGGGAGAGAAVAAAMAKPAAGSAAALAPIRYSTVPAITLGLLVMDRKRGGFDPEWGLEMLAKIKETLGKLPHEVYVPDVKVVDDPTLRKGVDLCAANGVDALVVVQPTISDGRLSTVLAQVWQHPLVLWATPEKQTGKMISSNSLVGTHLFAATLRQMGRRFELVYGNLDWKLAESQLRRAARVTYAARYIQQAKIGVIGGHAPGFVDLHPHPFIVNKSFGTQVEMVGLVEFMDEITGVDKDAVDADVAVASKLGLEFDDGTDASHIAPGSRAYLAFRNIIEGHGLDGVCIRCWPELPNKVGAWPYLALSRLATEGFPVACEGDSDGALGTLIGKLLGLGVVYLSDWLEHDASTITVWHGGFIPLQLTPRAAVALHFNNKRPGVVNGALHEDMEVTAYRFWVCDGQYHFMAIEGKTVPPKRALYGNYGVIATSGSESGKNVIDYFEELVHAGMPHHVCIVRGHHATTLKSFVRCIGSIKSVM